VVVAEGTASSFSTAGRLSNRIGSQEKSLQEQLIFPTDDNACAVRPDLLGVVFPADTAKASPPRRCLLVAPKSAINSFSFFTLGYDFVSHVTDTWHDLVFELMCWRKVMTTRSRLNRAVSWRGLKRYFIEWRRRAFIRRELRIVSNQHQWEDIIPPTSPDRDL
jgi:hypothetical protein